MAEARFFVDDLLRDGVEVTLEADDAHHAAHVLRLGVGSAVVLLARGAAWDARLVEAGGAAGVRARVIGPRDERPAELPFAVTVLQALVKGNKFDEVVEKCVELGARRIVPVICDRSYGPATAARLERWRRIARAAAQQSRRSMVPPVEEPQRWSSAVDGGAPLLVAWEGAEAGSLAHTMRMVGNAPELRIAVGPEGSFTDDELGLARSSGAHLISLGPTILRTETAAAAMLAAIASRHW